MNQVTIFLFIFGLVTVYSLSDEEIEKVKNLVDAELLKREMDVVVAKKPVAAKPVKTTPHPDLELQHSVDLCFDMYGSKKCKVLKGYLDCDKDRMHEMCEKTCGFCGNHMNPMVQCHNTEFGCCNDGLTVKTDPFGSTCPACKDKVESLCVDHVSDCNEVGMVGEWMRLNCKKSCDLCKKGEKKGKVAVDSNCHDDKEQEQFCPGWKAEGLCEQIPQMMSIHCAKTCGLC